MAASESGELGYGFEGVFEWAWCLLDDDDDDGQLRLCFESATATVSSGRFSRTRGRSGPISISESESEPGCAPGVADPRIAESRPNPPRRPASRPEEPRVNPQATPLPILSSVRETRAAVRAALGRAAVPRVLQIVDALPLRGIGKPDRAAVAHLLITRPIHTLE